MKAALNVRGVDFAVMPTRDFDTAVKFYGDTLGLRRSVFVPDRKYAEFETGNLTLMVIDPPGMNIEETESRNADRAPRRRRACGAHPAWSSNGSTFTGDIIDSGVCHQAFFADPDGNILILHHRYA